jgi:hypothetical protein
MAGVGVFQPRIFSNPSLEFPYDESSVFTYEMKLLSTVVPCLVEKRDRKRVTVVNQRIDHFIEARPRENFTIHHIIPRWVFKFRMPELVKYMIPVPELIEFLNLYDPNQLFNMTLISNIDHHAIHQYPYIMYGQEVDSLVKSLESNHAEALEYLLKWGQPMCDPLVAQQHMIAAVLKTYDFINEPIPSSKRKTFPIECEYYRDLLSDDAISAFNYIQEMIAINYPSTFRNWIKAKHEAKKRTQES